MSFVLYHEVRIQARLLRGQGGSEVDFHFFIDSDSEEWQFPGTFFEMKNIVPCQSYRIFNSQKYIQLHCAREH